MPKMGIPLYDHLSVHRTEGHQRPPFFLPGQFDQKSRFYQYDNYIYNNWPKILLLLKEVMTDAFILYYKDTWEESLTLRNYLEHCQCCKKKTKWENLLPNV